MTNALGRHILCEAYGCRFETLDSLKMVEKVLVEAAIQAGADVREVAFHQFSPQGVSGVVVISESHVAIHTWPEYGYAALDVFTCGDNVDPWDICRIILEQFGTSNYTAQEVRRGIFDKELQRKIS
ncbi:MAG: adenosylmethionine decarboxylase [Limnochordia bacterium]|jgi:S-adenosylmethionine decarboxylase|nr:adenosylmethionine decarboxylase [Limnochordia bacterium]MDD2630171.1 adenosylmethionine decarboxylase [Limnochordia bacterium]MDD4518265.1 adenosylmethionine decarboxylase [Limnochordia bacterium]